MNWKSKLVCAETKLQRALEHGSFDPVSGFTLDEIIDFLRSGSLALLTPEEYDIAEAQKIDSACAAVLRRNGVTETAEATPSQ